MNWWQKEVEVRDVNLPAEQTENGDRQNSTPSRITVDALVRLEEDIDIRSRTLRLVHL